jgi:hypothetical protein
VPECFAALRQVAELTYSRGYPAYHIRRCFAAETIRRFGGIEQITKFAINSLYQSSQLSQCSIA